MRPIFESRASSTRSEPRSRPAGSTNEGRRVASSAARPRYSSGRFRRRRLGERCALSRRLGARPQGNQGGAAVVHLHLDAERDRPRRHDAGLLRHRSRHVDAQREPPRAPARRRPRDPSGRSGERVRRAAGPAGDRERDARTARPAADNAHAPARAERRPLRARAPLPDLQLPRDEDPSRRGRRRRGLPDAGCSPMCAVCAITVSPRTSRIDARYNAKMSELHAAIGLRSLEHLDAAIARAASMPAPARALASPTARGVPRQRVPWGISNFQPGVLCAPTPPRRGGARRARHRDAALFLAGTARSSRHAPKLASGHRRSRRDRLACRFTAAWSRPYSTASSARCGAWAQVGRVPRRGSGRSPVPRLCDSVDRFPHQPVLCGISASSLRSTTKH